MNLSLLTFMFTLAYARQISPLPLVCSYNGTTHSDGDIVRTEEPCLSCVCRKGTLACSLRVCADAADTLPPGCFLLHKPDDCCPQVLCVEGFSQNGVELRTASNMADKLMGRNCLINGSVYAEGSAIVSNRKCEYCYCFRGKTKCVKPFCQRHFEGCKATYRQSSCCPTQYDCRHMDIDLLNSLLKNFAKAYSNNFPRSLLNLENETEESVSQEDKTTEVATTIQATTEVTTETETPSTTEESFTFQTLIPENLLASAEGTTPEIKDVKIRSKVDFDDVMSTNSSQDGEDYDAYDYTEPKLPPSLPNLVIFPFVAADAVVKGNPEPSDVSEIKRVDTQPVFYKDQFTPPVKTEGGFVPKEPDLAFYEYPYIRKELFETEQKAKPEVEVFQGADVTSDPFDGILIEDIPKKPVTVAYKNMIVDYYPDQLIATRGRYKLTTEMSMDEQSQTTFAKETFSFSDKSTTTSESSFFDEVLKSLLSEDTTTPAPTTKYKYLSKIKGSTKPEDVTEIKLNKKEEIKGYTKPTEETPKSQKEQEKKSQPEREGSIGALLKLAGCNIYGRMYRVGKVIVELSGPCLECVCTDLGVQCRALDC